MLQAQEGPGSGAGGAASHSPCEWLELAAVTLNRLVATRRLTTFFWGWKRMMWSLGANRQPRTTVPLRLTEMHMVVVCTCGE